MTTQTVDLKIEEIKGAIYNETLRIADQLIDACCEQGNMIYWETIFPLDDNKIEKAFQWDLYTGNAGILFFFIELYKNTGEKKYRDIIYKNASYLIEHIDDINLNACTFYSGQTGVMFVLLKAQEVIPELEINSHLDAWINKVDKIISSTNQCNDIFAGYAGIIFGLLQIHAISKNGKLPLLIDNLIQKLILSLNYTSIGIFGDRLHNQINGLCGFSHGSSGIAALFLELGHYFSNPAFYRISKDAFDYEDYYFNQLENNWPDLRKSFYYPDEVKKAEEAVKNGNVNYFTDTGYMQAWCHGAGGISLARLRAYELLKDKIFQKQALVGIDNIVKELNTTFENRTYTLCHGIGGNADICIEMYRSDGSPAWLNTAFKAAQEALKTRENTGWYKPGLYWVNEEDLSLFTGIAGIGYFFLRCLYPDKIPSILYPKIESIYNKPSTLNAYPFINYTLPDIQKNYLNKCFRAAAKFTMLTYPDKLTELIMHETSIGILKSNFFLLVQQIVAENNDLNLAEAINYDVCFDELSYRYNNAFLYTKAALMDKEILLTDKIDDSSLMNIEINFSDHNKLLTCKNNWLQYIRDAALPASQNDEEWYYVMMPTWKGVIEYQISWLSYKIITLVESKRSIPEIINFIAEELTISKRGRKDLTKKVISQIRELLKAKIVFIIK